MRIFPAFRSWVRLVVIFPLIVLAFGGYRGPSPAAQEHDSAEERRKDDPIKREQWFYNQRAYPMGRIPGNARLNALQEFDRMLEREGEAVRQPNGAMAPAIAASTTVWTPIGPQPTASRFFGNTSGRVTALAVDPTDPNRVFAGGAQGGVWRSLDGGATWTPLTDSQPSLAVGSIAIDPTSCSPAPCKTIYVGTGEENFAIDSYYGAGILKSTDGGDTWTQLGTPPGAPFVGPFNQGVGGARIGSIAVNSLNSQIILAGVQIISNSPSSGVYCSDNGGTTWTPVVSGAPATAILFDPTGTIAYAALGRVRPDNTNNGVYKSTNANLPCAAQIWTARNGTAPNVLPTGTNAGRIELAIAPSSPTTLYAAISNPASAAFGSLLGFFKTTDGGANWTRLTNTPDFCNTQCWYDMVVRVHPNNANVVYAGGSATLFYFARSTDGGNSWASGQVGANGTQIHVDQHAMAFGFTGGAASVLYIGNDGGVWSTGVSDPAAPLNWTNLNSALNITQFYPGLSIHPLDDQISFGGTQDNGTQKYSGSLVWQEVTCGDGGWTAIDPAAPSNVYVTCQEIGINKSVQNGAPATFVPADNGINPADRVSFIPPFVIDPNPANSQRLYFGTFRIWQTNDGASTWAAISGDLTGGSDSTTNPTLTTIAVAPSDSRTIYVGTSNARVQVATNTSAGSAIFTDVTKAPLPNRSVTQIGIDPTNAQTAYVTFSGFTFPAAGDTVGHVFKTSNGGASWTDISGNLPNTPVNDIVIDPEDPARRLYVATDVGVFQTSDGGATWSTLVAGLPRVAVLSLKLREASRTLRAATHGRGVWDLTLPSFPDFSLSSPTGAQTISPGGSATYTVIVTPQNGFTSPVTLSCTNPPAVITCSSFNPQTVTPGMTPGNSATVTLTASSSALLPSVPVGRPGTPLSAPWLILVALVLAAAAFAAHHSRQRRLAIYLPLAATVLLLAVQVAGCGGGGSSPPPPTPRNYTITVTGTAAAGASRTTTLTLIVR